MDKFLKTLSSNEKRRVFFCLKNNLSTGHSFIDNFVSQTGGNQDNEKEQLLNDISKIENALKNEIEKVKADRDNIKSLLDKCSQKLKETELLATTLKDSLKEKEEESKDMVSGKKVIESLTGLIDTFRN